MRADVVGDRIAGSDERDFERVSGGVGDQAHYKTSGSVPFAAVSGGVAVARVAACRSLGTGAVGARHGGGRRVGRRVRGADRAGRVRLDIRISDPDFRRRAAGAAQLEGAAAPARRR